MNDSKRDSIPLAIFAFGSMILLDLRTNDEKNFYPCERDEPEPSQGKVE